MNCLQCGQSISQDRRTRHAKFCSPACRRHAARERYTVETGSPGRNDIATTTTGAMHELLVCADLMKMGCHVFRAQSPSCPCDITVLVDGQLYKIEVTTGYKKSDGGISFPRKNSRYDFDVIAVVFHSGEITYLSDGNCPTNIPCLAMEDHNTPHLQPIPR